MTVSQTSRIAQGIETVAVDIELGFVGVLRVGVTYIIIEVSFSVPKTIFVKDDGSVFRKCFRRLGKEKGFGALGIAMDKSHVFKIHVIDRGDGDFFPSKAERDASKIAG